MDQIKFRSQNLVDVNDPLWKNFEKFDEHYAKVIKEENPNRTYDNALAQEWVKHAKKALEKKGINPKSVSFKQISKPRAIGEQTEFAHARTGPMSYSEYSNFFWTSRKYTGGDSPTIALHQPSYESTQKNLNPDIQKAVSKHLSEHEVTHLEKKHPLTKTKMTMYHDIKGIAPDYSRYTDAIEKTADTLRALESRKKAHSAFTSLKHGYGYKINMPDIEIEKSYHDVEHLKKQQQQIQATARQVQRKIQQSPLNKKITSITNVIGSKAANVITAPYKWYRKTTE